MLIQKGLVKSQVDEKRKSKFLAINGVIQKFHFRDGKKIDNEKLKDLKDVLAKKKTDFLIYLSTIFLLKLFR